MKLEDDEMKWNKNKWEIAKKTLNHILFGKVLNIHKKMNLHFEAITIFLGLKWLSLYAVFAGVGFWILFATAAWILFLLKFG
ncbi:hypothetical protein P3L10_008320 [Capsicum annuum]